MKSAHRSDAMQAVLVLGLLGVPSTALVHRSGHGPDVYNASNNLTFSVGSSSPWASDDFSVGSSSPWADDEQNEHLDPDAEIMAKIEKLKRDILEARKECNHGKKMAGDAIRHSHGTPEEQTQAHHERDEAVDVLAGAKKQIDEAHRQLEEAKQGADKRFDGVLHEEEEDIKALEHDVDDLDHDVRKAEESIADADSGVEGKDGARQSSEGTSASPVGAGTSSEGSDSKTTDGHGAKDKGLDDKKSHGEGEEGSEKKSHSKSEEGGKKDDLFIFICLGLLILGVGAAGGAIGAWFVLGLAGCCPCLPCVKPAIEADPGKAA